LLYDSGKYPNRISLPTYPFAREHYWITASEKLAVSALAYLHPLLHLNESDFSTQKYRSIFSGREPFFTDHLVNSKAVLPGVAFLELAREAGKRGFHKPITQIKDISWIKRFQIDGLSRQIEVHLFEKEQSIGFEIYSPENGQEVIYSEGKLGVTTLVTPEKVSIDGIKSKLTRQVSKKECYRTFKEIGLDYGNSFQGIEMLLYNDTEALSKINLPVDEHFVLQPGILDSALQTAVYFRVLQQEASLFLPFSAKTINVFGEVSQTYWCHVQLSRANQNDQQLSSYNIKLLSELGEVLLSIEDFLALPVKEHESKKESSVIKNHSVALKEETAQAILPYKKEKLYPAASIFLKELISDVIKLPVDRLKNGTHFDQYGIDSITITRLNRKFNEVFENLPSTLFFEHQNLESLIGYFVSEYASELMLLTGIKDSDIEEEVKEEIRAVIPTTSRFTKQASSLKKQEKNENNEPIAIIGLSGKYPGAKDVNAFWENLKAGIDSVTEIPEERWSITEFFDPEKGTPGKSYSKWGGFIEDVDKFDPLFFNITPKEAELMDPQERLFLQTTWEALEDAGYTRLQIQELQSSALNNTPKVGVYAGVMYEEYQLFGVEESLKGNPLALAGSPSSIANRVSYYLDLHGPSMAVDTMCSSSLTAIHLAIKDIHSNECAMAIAGGVNVTIHPNKYKMLSQSRFVSDKGRCESFGEGGNGYVPAEGVGVVILKRLSEAIADGDQIYGVIKGSSLNHGGRTNGFTVPNPNAQAAAIKRAMDKAGVKPKDFSYIEAHGTGTSLGDPIEIAGLTKVFNSTEDNDQFCVIGSVKSNIGHAESAAGIAGLTKILLQFKYQQLAPSLHSKTLNHRIDFEQTPFRVQQKLEYWESADNLARIAGISSFGAGGSNAHLVVEEYTQARRPYQSDKPAIILLSAKDTERLREQAVNLENYLKSEDDIDIYDVAYTLQIGREPMEERLAFIVNDKSALINRLEDYLKGRTTELFTGNINKAQNDFLLEGGSGKAYINYAIEHQETKSLAQLWTKGVTIDWRLIYTQDNRPNKITLPTYPFAKERYWIPKSGSTTSTNVKGQLHPLLHSNESDLEKQKFESIFTGREAFIKDHKVRGMKILPGVAHLELAREAGKRSIHQNITRISNINWLRPLQINGRESSVQIALFDDGEHISYEIYSPEGAQESIYSTGRLDAQTVTPPPTTNISAIKERLTGEIKGSECYEVFKKRGLHYGKSFQGITHLRFNDREALSTIKIIENPAFVLQPGLLDGALQTCMGIGLEQDRTTLDLPYSIKTLTIYGDVSQAYWCHARKLGNAKTTETLCRYNIDLFSKEGEVLLSIKELETLPDDRLDDQENKTLSEDVNLHLYVPKWELTSCVEQDYDQEHTPLIVLAGGSVRLAEQLTETLQQEVMAVNAATEVSYFKQIFTLIQSRIKDSSSLYLTLLYQESNYLDYAFISGLLKTAQLELPQFRAKMIGVNSLSLKEAIALADLIKREQADDAFEVRYKNGIRETLRVTNLSLEDKEEEEIKIKEGGLYLITGGAGGLGKLFATHLAKTPNTKLILTGRAKEPKITDEELEQLNAIYIPCDVTDAQVVKEVIKSILEKESKLDGIIHSAGVLRDRLLLNKAVEESEVVLETKIQGAKNLDQATKDLELDFTIYFSSIVGVTGNIGQSDYSSANAWMDHFAHYRNQLRAQGRRTGVTLSINWPLWAEGGMQLNAADQKAIEQYWGLHLLPTETGLGVLDGLLQTGVSQAVVGYGVKSKLEKNVFGLLENKLQQKNPSLTNTEKNFLAEKTERYLKELLAEVTKLPIHKIESSVLFEEYGIDSVMITTLNRKLSAVFDDLPSTIFFEYQNLESLIIFLLSEYSERLQEITGLNQESTKRLVSTVQDHHSELIQTRKSRTSSSAKLSIRKDFAQNQDPVAIIGLSGRYPGAMNIQEFWNNLRKGKDTITEIPKDRWPIAEFFDTEKGKAGKSYSKWGGFISDVDKFDPLFFNISPREAELMDPQERLFLQTAWEAVEDAGYTRSELQQLQSPDSVIKGQVGVYAGVMYEEYQLFGAEESLKGNPLALAGSPSSIANRVSYFLDLHGPSMAIDTMCSSSLTAIHLAITAIRKGECKVAIAGGVNVSVHPNKYKLLSQSRFVSDKGRCESFGEGGNGYVPAEGVGVVILKRLSEAERDGDQIYGIIKGSSLNHGGKTNGYTVPNPNAQAAVIQKAIADAGVQPGDFSYIEAHGTGTSLGDPIEIAGLSKAFKDPEKEGQYCAIGSVKSNIGHAESAAGIAGLTKILLQFKYQKLIPSLHSTTLNQQINFEKTPFKVQQKLEDWVTINDQPRLAGISSFGAGGSNAHLIVQEYRPGPFTYKSDEPAIVLLSARNSERLQEQVNRLAQFLETNPKINLYDVAYTLQVGREGFEERMAFLASDLHEFKSRLKAFLEGNTSEILRGNVKKEKHDFLLKGNAGKKYIETAIRDKELESLAQLWVKGVVIDWHLLYDQNHLPRKLSIPTYAFAKERYWVPQSESSVPSNVKSRLHPLLHQNVSNFAEQKFQSVFLGKESFLVDHQVNEIQVLPGVAYLELAREAAARSSEQPITQIYDIKWFNPLAVNKEHKQIEISLFDEEDRIGFEIYSQQNNDEVLHVQGNLTTKKLRLPPAVNIEGIKNRLSNKITGADCYDAFKKRGLNYGSSFRGIHMLYYSSHEALSQVSLPEIEHYILQPGILDSALQTCIGLGMGQGEQLLTVPFSIKKLDLFSDLSLTHWCHVKRSEHSKTSEKFISYDIDVLSEDGNVLLSIKDFVSLPVKDTHPEKVVTDQESTDLHLFTAYWSEQVPEVQAAPRSKALILLAGASANLSEHLMDSLEQEVFTLKETSEIGYFEEVLTYIQSKITPKEPIDITVLYRNADYVNFGFISGLLKTAELEHPEVKAKTIGVDQLSFKDAKALATILQTERTDQSREVRYQNEKREVRQIGYLPETNEKRIEIKEGGVYLITGGAGGLGKLFAAHIAKVTNTKLILTGRSVKPKLNVAELNELNATYYSCDITNKASVEQLIDTIIEEEGTLDGIIHSAGVLRDSFILKKTAEEAKDVLSAKILGARYLDRFTQDVELDFCVYFSSLAGAFGNVGQADYGAANAWLDIFAHHRNDLCLAGKRKGITLSINWPLWEEGGMEIDKETEYLIEQKWGLQPLPTYYGLLAMDVLLGQGSAHGIVTFGKRSKIQSKLIKKIEIATSAHTKDNLKPNLMESKAEEVITKLVSQLLKLDIKHLSPDEEFGAYGFDSVLLTKLANSLNDFYGIDLVPTVFYNYPNIQELGHYLATDYPKELAKIHADTSDVRPVVNAVSVPQPIAEAPQSRRGKRKKRYQSIDTEPLSSPSATEPIAIIGMSGRFPGAPDLNTFWEQLKSNKDLISEIPKDRWDWREYYGNAQDEKGKTKVKWGGFIEDIDKFDPLHFNIAPSEATLMDPQHRLALLATYHALEDAGIDPYSIKGSNTGVFIGVSTNDYFQLINSFTNHATQAKFSMGTAHCMLVNRISYLLDLHGPSEPVDTACSSSLIAIHRAAENIRNGHCNLAIVGGVNALLSPELTLSFSRAGFLSEDGRCKTFDQKANGYVRGEGVGVIILKRLSQAEADGDQIHALIRSTAENHGGKANTLTSPNPNAQKELLLKAYRYANIDPRRVSYIEAHGTGTPLGDPVEAEGLKLAFRELYKENGLQQAAAPHIRLGSVKANIGHLESAAGIAGVLKVVLSLKNKMIPGNPHLQTPNEFLQLENSPFLLQKETTDWEGEDNQSRIAGVSSFGFGGTNAHVVIEEYSKQTQGAQTQNRDVCIVLSAKNSNRLKEQATNLYDFLQKNESLNLQDIAYTLQVGRAALEERLAFVVNDLIKLCEILKEYQEGKTDQLFSGNTKKNKNTFLLSGSAGKAYVKEAIKEKELSSLGQLWVQGMTIDWHMLYDEYQPPNKVSLPTYAFAKDRYWIPQLDSPVAIRQKGSKVDEGLPENEEAKQLYYSPVWKPVSLSAHLDSTSDKGTILILGEENGFSLQLKSVLKLSNAKVILEQQLNHIAPDIKAVFFLQGLQAASDKRKGKDRIEDQELAVFRSIKRLMEKGIKYLEVTFLTHHTQAVYPSEKLQENGAGIIGLAGSLAKEIPGWQIRVIDINKRYEVAIQDILRVPFSSLGRLQALRGKELFQSSLVPIDLNQLLLRVVD
jgi:polyketide synthase PksN